MKRLRTLLLFALAILPATALFAQTPTRRVLPNGLTVLVLENHAAPVVAVRVYVKTGSIYEGQYLGSGISHLFEHTLGEGTAKQTKVQLNAEIEAIGGQSNAYTSKDVTVYHITTAASYFERALANLADTIQHASFPEAEVKTQQGVIHNEMNLDEDDPDRAISELFYNTAFLVHPVRFPIIGYPEPFDRLTRDDIINYYKSHYTPENSLVAVAGDIDTKAAMDAVTSAFKDWPRRAAAQPPLPQEPVQTTPRRAVETKNIGLTYLQVGWHTVPLQHPDLYALDTLAQVLGGGESSRLVQDLRDNRRLVASISAFSSTPNYDAGVFGIRATLTPNKLSEVEQALTAQIDKVISSGVTSDELQRAQRQIEANFIFNNSAVEEQAEQMAYDELATGDPAYSRRYVERIKAVTAARVQEVARLYLTAEGKTTAIVQPPTAEVATASAATTPRASQPVMTTLPNGLRLIVRENHAAPTVAIVVTALGGNRLEPAGKAGMSNLVAEMLTRGTRKRTAPQIAAIVDQLGGNLDGFSGYNSWGLRSQWLAADWRKGLSLVQESLLTPSFPAEELTGIKNQVTAQLQEQEDDPTAAASLLLRRTYYGDYPYGRSALGETSQIPAITAADVRRFWERTLQPRSMVMTVYGDVNAEEVRRAVEYQFGTFKGSPEELRAPAAPPALARFTSRTTAKPGLAQAVLFLGYPGINVQNPDRYAVDILDAALSGANLPGGRLHQRLRDNQLVYVVHAFDQPGLDLGMFVVYAASTKANRPEVQRVIEEEIARIKEAPISAAELAAAKSMMIAAHAIDNQTNLAQATSAASDELFGLGYGEQARFEAAINAVTAADVQRVAQKYLRTEAAALAIVEPQDK